METGPATAGLLWQEPSFWSGEVGAGPGRLRAVQTEPKVTSPLKLHLPSAHNAAAGGCFLKFCGRH